jgi:hypothetical protein
MVRLWLSLIAYDPGEPGVAADFDQRIYPGRYHASNARHYM